MVRILNLRAEGLGFISGYVVEIVTLAKLFTHVSLSTQVYEWVQTVVGEANW